jgi:hypothetical protein
VCCVCVVVIVIVLHNVFLCCLTQTSYVRLVQACFYLIQIINRVSSRVGSALVGDVVMERNDID